MLFFSHKRVSFYIVSTLVDRGCPVRNWWLDSNRKNLDDCTDTDAPSIAMLHPTGRTLHSFEWFKKKVVITWCGLIGTWDDKDTRKAVPSLVAILFVQYGDSCWRAATGHQCSRFPIVFTSLQVADDSWGDLNMWHVWRCSSWTCREPRLDDPEKMGAFTFPADRGICWCK